MLGSGLFLLMYGFYPFIPGRAGWHKLLFLEALLGVGLLGYSLFVVDQPRYSRDLLLMAMGLVAVIGVDFGGVTPLYKSDLDPLLGKLGLKRIGPIDFGERAKIIGGKIVLNQPMCTGCGICYDVCPTGVYAIERNGRKAVVIKSPELCEACEACAVQWPRGGLSFESRSHV